MSARLVALVDIPYAARDAELRARAKHGSRADALAAAQYRIVSAPGCHVRPSFDPPVVGWVCSEVAAKALSDRMTRMPDGKSHRRLAYEVAS